MSKWPKSAFVKALYLLVISDRVFKTVIHSFLLSSLVLTVRGFGFLFRCCYSTSDMLMTISKITHIYFVDDFLAKNKYLKDNPDMMSKVEKDIEGSLHNFCHSFWELLYNGLFKDELSTKNVSEKLYTPAGKFSVNVYWRRGNHQVLKNHRNGSVF